MLYKSKYIFIFYFFILNGVKAINLRFDPIGQFEYVLNELNPYSQSKVEVGVFEITGLANLPYSKMQIEIDSFSDLDSLKTLSLFSYRRGDYAYRETSIMLDRYLDHNRSITVKGFGRKFPGKANNYGSDYILDNYLLNYSLENDFLKFDFSNYYHKEDLELPVINYNKSRFSEIFGLAFNIKTPIKKNYFGNDFEFSINYQNLFFSGFGYEYENDSLYGGSSELINSYLGKNQLNLKYISYPIANMLFDVDILLKKNKSEYSVSLIDEMVRNSKLRVQYLMNYDISFDFGIYNFKSRYENLMEIFYKLKFSFKKSNWLKDVTFQKDYDFNDLNLVEDLNYNLYYDKLNLSLGKNQMNLNLSFYKVKLKSKFDILNNENGKLMKISFDYSNDSSTTMGLNFHDYRDFSPIDNNFSLFSSFVIDVPNETYSFFSYIRFDFIKLNPGHVIVNDYSGMWAQGEQNKALSYKTNRLEFGLKFKNFIISYNLLNNFDEVNFSDFDSNINETIYGLNYLSIKWQFHD